MAYYNGKKIMGLVNIYGGSGGGAVDLSDYYTKEEVKEINEPCEDFLGVNFNVELGNIDVNSGAEVANVSRARSDFIYLKNGYSIIGKNNYIFYVVKFDDNKNWIGNSGAFVSTYEVTTDGYYRLMFVNNAIGNLTNSLGDLKENIYILTNKSDFNKDIVAFCF